MMMMKKKKKKKKKKKQVKFEKDISHATIVSFTKNRGIPVELEKKTPPKMRQTKMVMETYISHILQTATLTHKFQWEQHLQMVHLALIAMFSLLE